MQWANANEVCLLPERILVTAERAKARQYRDGATTGRLDLTHTALAASRRASIQRQITQQDVSRGLPQAALCTRVQHKSSVLGIAAAVSVLHSATPNGQASDL